MVYESEMTNLVRYKNAKQINAKYSEMYVVRINSTNTNVHHLHHVFQLAHKIGLYV